MQGYKLQENQRIMGDEITGGIDELGVLLLGHNLTGWWTESQLGIDEARKLAPHQNATTLQVCGLSSRRTDLDIEPPRGRAVRDR